jgi:hypothetical protein
MDTKSPTKGLDTIYAKADLDLLSVIRSISKKMKDSEGVSVKTSSTEDSQSGRKCERITITSAVVISEPSETTS